MNETIRLAAINTAATALAYQEHGFKVTITCIDGYPTLHVPAGANELTICLAALTGTIAEALAMQQTDTCTTARPFSDYYMAASYTAGQAPLSRQGLGRPAILAKIKNRLHSQYSAVQALADQILASISELQEVAA